VETKMGNFKDDQEEEQEQKEKKPVEKITGGET
jgi:hypothetical protein